MNTAVKITSEDFKRVADDVQIALESASHSLESQVAGMRVAETDLVPYEGDFSGFVNIYARNPHSDKIAKEMNEVIVANKAMVLAHKRGRAIFKTANDLLVRKGLMTPQPFKSRASIDGEGRPYGGFQPIVRSQRPLPAINERAHWFVRRLGLD